MEQDESWYPPIKSSHHENIQTEDNNFTPKTRKINKENNQFLNYTVDKLSSPSESPFSWEESPMFNRSSASVSEIKVEQDNSTFLNEKKGFFSDNDTLPPSSPSTIAYSPLLYTR